MNTDQIQMVFKYTSFLLNYPSTQWLEDLEACKIASRELPHKQISSGLVDFIELLERSSQEELVENYVNTFDFGKKTNLYVTYMKLGEQRERGLELLQLKNLYAKAGFHVTDEELPDFLPLMLEFAGWASADDAKYLLSKYRAGIEDLREQLIHNRNSYAVLFDVLLMAMEEMGATGAEGSVAN